MRIIACLQCSAVSMQDASYCQYLKTAKPKQKHCKALPSVAVDKETVVTDDFSFSPPFVVILLYFHYLSTTLQVVLNFGKLNC